MRKIIQHFRNNALLYLDLVVFTILLVVNLFVGYQLFTNVIEDVTPANTSEVGVTVTKLVTLEDGKKELFEEDQQYRRTFKYGEEEAYTNIWDSLSKQVDPFLRQ